MTGQLISAKLVGWSESTLLLFVCCSLVINELCKQTNTKMHQSKLFHYGSECVITPHCQSSKSKKHKGTNCGEVGSDWQDKGLWVILMIHCNWINSQYLHHFPRECVALWCKTPHYSIWVLAGDTLFHKWCKCSIDALDKLLSHSASFLFVQLFHFPVCRGDRP